MSSFLLIDRLIWFFTAVWAQTNSWPHHWSLSQHKQSFSDGFKSFLPLPLLLLQGTTEPLTTLSRRRTLGRVLSQTDGFCCICTDHLPSGLWKSVKASFEWNGPKADFGCALVPICRPTINRGAAHACSCLIGNQRLESVLRDIWQRKRETCDRWVNGPKYADECKQQAVWWCMFTQNSLVRVVFAISHSRTSFFYSWSMWKEYVFDHLYSPLALEK